MEPEKTARERFVLEVRKAGGSKVVAAQLGCTRSYVDMIRTGQRRPGLLIAFRIQRAFEIPMQRWIEDEEPRPVAKELSSAGKG